MKLGFLGTGMIANEMLDISLTVSGIVKDAYKCGEVVSGCEE